MKSDENVTLSQTSLTKTHASHRATAHKYPLTVPAQPQSTHGSKGGRRLQHLHIDRTGCSVYGVEMDVALEQDRRRHVHAADKRVDRAGHGQGGRAAGSAGREDNCVREAGLRGVDVEEKDEADAAGHSEGNGEDTIRCRIGRDGVCERVKKRPAIDRAGVRGVSDDASNLA